MSEKILIVDDEKDVANFVMEYLVSDGFDVTVSNSGNDALFLLKNTQFDVLIVDMRLEGRVSGVDVIKSFSQAVRRPKIIVMSATPFKHLEPIFQQERIARLVDDVLEKPDDMTPGIITKIIKKLVNKS
ncbi:MAG: hypothetical protein A3G33_08525 [Omnitrophica bacterium RIFCSPLOWO2_12_FULL_44_17]|uniref:Response regulatory domain-containing protein n=1 Tax=Candidatus Danuiimicrobium aquiferis TaxID=1801832 RepID=A0A1G1KWE2_9BACT|nr:MAG: hypothetical protein A3B72_03745 [Omnitrophica bacterium RIFCSPHIGHO2_02_FULL_45_28]OGW90300.1 MAG: hypothetical protein A3E74_01270 [Omnitrophica bacterium RIFCSPHIGHO2_12_FULL_44_12]OGW97210.1 MAG: hypothetical protein A3G33_08525 [Omnitrophica bacterium RIFCSPLOWO2_12_FULL_44_17]OGX02266.1 MAG: hypothetical protein A3J12_08315 [Omnitrophica bacterium RIFCSPLOWO2_02_FULL_44_11]